jgi:predicted membrane-bound mannosyltransferase/DNA-binding beta-propeller fold protein YncE
MTMQTIETKTESWLDRPLVAALNWERAALLLIFLVAVISRFYDLGARVMSHDESLHTMYSYYLIDGRGYSHTPLMHGPFLFHVTALSYFLFGDSDFTARLPFAIFGIALVMLPQAFRRQLGREGALAACVLILISPSLLYHARYIRQEVTVLIWTMLTAISIWRYMETRAGGWLLTLAAVLALHGSDKSTSFLTVAMFVAFLAPVALWQLYRVRTERRDALRAVWFAAVCAAALVIASIAMELLSGRISGLLGVESIVSESAAPVVNPRTLLFLALMATMIGGLGVLLYAALRRLFGDWLVLAEARSSAWNLIVVMVITTTFMGSPSLLLLLNPLWKAVGGEALINVALLGEDINIKTNPQVISTMLALALAVAMVGVVIGLVWNRRRAIAVLAIFIAITLPLFTTMFTNTGGIGTGYVGQLGYWMAQQDVMRGNQPPYYYLLLVPLYEYVNLAGTLGAIVYLSVEIVLRGAFGSAGALSKIRQHFFPILLTWWALATWAIYSIAGEKMPWLTVHIALPQILLTGWLLQRCVEEVRVDARRSGWLAAGVAVLAIVFGVRMLSVIGGIDPAAERGAQVTAAANFLIAGAAVAACVIALRRLLVRGSGAAIAMAGFGLLSLLTVRTAVTASYIYYDYTREFLFYAHGAPGVKIITAQLDDVARRLGVPESLTVGYTQETSWPMSWYMRSYPGNRFLGADLPEDAESLQAIVASEQDAKFNEWAERLSTTHVRFNYAMVWWPMEDYRDLTWERIRFSLVDREARAALWSIIFDRDFRKYSEVFDKTSLTAETWSPSHRITLFLRNDIAEQVWQYRTAAVASGNRAVAVPKIQEPANVAFAADGTRWVIDHKANRLFQLDANGAVQQAFGGSGAAPGKFNDPWGVVVDADGGVFVADTFNHRVQKFGADGSLQFTWGSPGASQAPGVGRETQFFGPRDIVIDAEGRLLVTDTGNKRVQVFDREGNFVAQFGSAGGGDGQFDEPVGLALDSAGNIYVADTWNKRIQVWSKDFVWQRSFPVPAWETMLPEDLQAVDHKPYLAVGGDTLYVSSPRGGEILGFSLSGQPKEIPSVTLERGDIPTGVEVRDGRLYVTNARNGAIVEFDVAAGAQ